MANARAIGKWLFCLYAVSWLILYQIAILWVLCTSTSRGVTYNSNARDVLLTFELNRSYIFWLLPGLRSLMAEGEGDGLYCLCRRPYQESEFMIECDVCKDWFHGRYEIFAKGCPP